MINQYEFQRVWQSVDRLLGEEIIAFWLANGALRTREAAIERLAQVAYIARSGAGGIIAVTTSYLQFIMNVLEVTSTTCGCLYPSLSGGHKSVFNYSPMLKVISNLCTWRECYIQQ